MASSFIFPSISSVPSLLGVKEGSSFEGTYFQTNTGHPEGITRYLGKGISFEMEKFYIKVSYYKFFFLSISSIFLIQFSLFYYL